MRMILMLLLLLLPVRSHAENKVSPANVQMVMQRMVDDVIRPGYARFEQAAEALETRTAALCNTPSAKALEEARVAFRDAVLAWAGVEFIRFGPVTAQDRLERVLFWPDRKGTGLKQVQQALAKADESVTDPGALATKSVAMQGLGAQEFLLFGSGSQALEESDGAGHRCAFAHAAAANIHAIAGEIARGWAPQGEASLRWTVGRDPEVAAERLNEIIGTLVHGVDAVRDMRIRGFVDAAGANDKPRQALYWRSQMTGPVIAANLAGLQVIFEESAIEALLPSDVSSIAGSIRFELIEAVDLAKPLRGTPEAMLADTDQRQRLMVLDTVIDSLVDRIDTQFAPATGLASGFSFSDGD
jgi:predicted lipoprotein